MLLNIEKNVENNTKNILKTRNRKLTAGRGCRPYARQPVARINKRKFTHCFQEWLVNTGPCVIVFLKVPIVAI